MRRIVSSILAILIISSSFTFAVEQDRKHVNLSKEVIVSLIYDEIGKQVDKDDIEEIKTLLDFSKNKYTLVEFKNTGYLIIDNETLVFSEYSFNSLSPYLALESKLYYVGPMQYYYKDGKGYKHTITNEYVSDNETINEMMNLSSNIQTEFKKQKSLKTTKTSFASSASSNEVVSAYLIKSLSSKNDFGYVSGGYCGYIASNIYLFWLDRTQNSDVVDKSYIYGYRLNGPGLTNHLISIGEGLGIGNSTTAFSIHEILNKYFKDRNIAVAHQSNVLPFTSYVKDQIDRNKPYIVFGRLDNPNGGKVNHAVLVYGYENDKLIAHFGWNGYSEVRINGIWGSGYAVRLQ